MLNSVIGIVSDCKKYLEFRQKKQMELLRKPTKIAKTSIQKTYACYNRGVQEKFSILTRKTTNAMDNFETYEKIIKEQLIPNPVGKDTLNPSSVRYLPFPSKWAAITSSCDPTMKTI